MFEEMGWTVSETCSSSTDTPISGLSASNDGPTLLGTTTQMNANITGGSNVERMNGISVTAAVEAAFRSPTNMLPPVHIRRK